MSLKKIGILGCGAISKHYFEGIQAYDGFEIAGCADLREASARERAEEFNVPFRTISDLLADPEIEVITNLTIPAAHAEVNLQALEAGKSVYCEKPFALTREEGQKVLQLAEEKGLGLACAPDTILGEGHQTARAIIDSGDLGKIVGGCVFMVSGGVDHWHRNPAFYYQPGGGPLFDMGPYYFTALVNLLGPVKAVHASTSRAFSERDTKHAGVVPVNVNTHYSGTLEFENGALINAVFSFDSPGGARLPFVQIYGTSGTLDAPDPNLFDGENHVRLARKSLADPLPEWQVVKRDFPHFGRRGLGPIDLANAMRHNRPPRVSGQLAYHVLDTMIAFDESGASQQWTPVHSTCDRPTPVPETLPDRTWPE